MANHLFGRNGYFLKLNSVFLVPVVLLKGSVFDGFEYHM